MKAATYTIGVLAAVLLWPGASRADHAQPSQAQRLDIQPTRVRQGTVKVDGFINDWRSVPTLEVQALTRGEPEYDWTGPRDLSLVVQSQVDEETLYLAIEVRDNQVVGPKGRKGGDRVEIWLDGGPAAKERLRMLEVSIGDIEAGGKPTARWGHPKSLRGAPAGLQLDGALRAPEGKTQGYFLEIGLPLSQISDPPPGWEPVGIAVIARDWDYDDPNEDEAAVATAPFDARKERDVATLGRLQLGDLPSQIEGFLRHKPAARKHAPQFAQWGDLGGDGRREYVAQLGPWLLLIGQGLGAGQYYYYELPTPGQLTPTGVELRDLTGDGLAEVIVRYEMSYADQGVTQEMMAIFHYAQDRLLLSFQSETGNRGAGWSFQNQVKIKPGKGKRPATLLVTRGKLQGSLEPAAYPDVDKDQVVDWDRALLPWQSDSKRTYTWSNGQFLKEQK